MQGYFSYHAVPGNLVSLRSFRLQVIHRRMRALRRRGKKYRVTWPRLVALADRWLPQPAILHPYPNLCFDADIRGKSRMQQSCTCGSLRERPTRRDRRSYHRQTLEIQSCRQGIRTCSRANCKKLGTAENSAAVS